MADATPVDRLYFEARDILSFLSDKIEPSLRSSAADSLRKILLLAAASYFEYRTCEIVLEFIREKTLGSVEIEQFVRNKAVTRQYHTWFSWEKKNANSFFSLFGPGFRSLMEDKVAGSETLRDSIRSFMDIGSQRNQLSHNDIATYPIDKTLDEIYADYKNGIFFLDTLPGALREKRT